MWVEDQPVRRPWDHTQTGRVVTWSADGKEVVVRYDGHSGRSVNPSEMWEPIPDASEDDIDAQGKCNACGQGEGEYDGLCKKCYDQRNEDWRL